ncbi:MAG: tRNA (adenosine(37)-N6)-threonylcarbamoyltransferase complex ATPase subunit type 1 TsaE [Arcticibacter sp.]
MMNHVISALDELPGAAVKLLSFATQERVFLFYGEMGAGKTTFIKALCEQLGVTDTTSSPTFSIVNEYEYAGGSVYHFDFYRLKDQSEAFDLGYEDYLYSGQYCFIEWPEKIPDLIPQRVVKVSLELIDGDKRSLTAEIQSMV